MMHCLISLLIALIFSFPILRSRMSQIGHAPIQRTPKRIITASFISFSAGVIFSITPIVTDNNAVNSWPIGNLLGRNKTNGRSCSAFSKGESASFLPQDSTIFLVRFVFSWTLTQFFFVIAWSGFSLDGIGMLSSESSVDKLLDLYLISGKTALF